MRLRTTSIREICSTMSLKDFFESDAYKDDLSLSDDNPPDDQGLRSDGQPYDQDRDYEERTGQTNYCTYADDDHHTEASILMTIPGLDSVNHFILDPMHLLYEAVMKRPFECWFEQLTNNDCKMSSAQKLELHR